MASNFQTGDKVRVRPEVDLNRLFGSVTWPDGNIEGTVVGKAFGDSYYVDFPQFRNESPVGYWPIYGHELDAIPDDLAALQAENARLRDALEMFAGVWDEWLLVRNQAAHRIMGFAHWYSESWLDSNDERAFENARKALGGE